MGLILVWIAGILVVSVGLSSFEMIIESKLQHLPIFLDLIRGLRYVIPLLEILLLWPLAFYWNKAEPETDLSTVRRIGLAGLALGIILVFSLMFPKTFLDYRPYANFRIQTLVCLSESKIVCPSQELKDEMAIIEYIRASTERNASIFSIPPTDMGSAVRFQALHPVAFDPSDMIRLAPGNLSGTIDMEKDVKEWSMIDLLPEDEKLAEYLEFGRRRQAEIAIVRNPIPDWLSGNVIFSNQTYSLIKLQ